MGANAAALGGAVAAAFQSAKRVRRLLPALLALLVFASPAAANDVVRDCAQDGELSGDYGNEELTSALREIPADVDEYSDCRAVIAGAVNPEPTSSRGNTSGGGAPGGGDSFRRNHGGEAAPGKPVKERAGKRRARERLESEPDASMSDSQGPKPFKAGDATTDLPAPILPALIASGLIGVAGAAFAVRRKHARGSPHRGSGGVRGPVDQPLRHRGAHVDAPPGWGNERVLERGDEAPVASALGEDHCGDRPPPTARTSDDKSSDQARDHGVLLRS